MQQNKQILIDAVVHAVNEDYAEMANDFTRLGFLASGTDVSPIVPALEAIWQNSAGKGLADFNFRSVTGKAVMLRSLSIAENWMCACFVLHDLYQHFFSMHGHQIIFLLKVDISDHDSWILF